ncbi:hypothetical protein OIE68_19935 [Nocardia vinacea]|uniref:hypothetical protein n=1 Tax=Nocardia vinacea TaxID=96468 RepID=UPI002E14452B|nr:hypothetical protein OIE68_19935 [Nocardia vinacea]
MTKKEEHHLPAAGIINREDVLGPNQWMTSKNGEYRMGLREGQLVIEHVPTNTRVNSFGDPNHYATTVRFEDEVGDDTRQRLELQDADGKTIPSQLLDDRSGQQGGAWTPDWQDPNNEKKGAQQYVLTDNGELIALKVPVDPASWDGKRPPNATVLWYQELPNVADKRAYDDDMRAFTGHKAQIPAEANLKDFPLQFRIPPGLGSPGFQTAVKVMNAQLSSLADQLGKGKPEKPSLLISPEKGVDNNEHDNNLAENFYETLTGSGATQDAADSGNFKLNILAAFWKADDVHFEQRVGQLTRWNLATYQNMYNKIQETHETVAETLRVRQAGPQAPAPVFIPPGTQPPSEQQVSETLVYPPMARAVKYCVDQVVEYTRLIEGLPPDLRPPAETQNPPVPPGQQNPPQGQQNPQGGGQQNPPQGQGQQNPGSGSGSGNGQSGNGGGNGGSADSQNPPEAPTGQPLNTTPESTHEDFGSTYDDLLGTPTDAKGAVDSTQPTQGSGTGDTASSPDIDALLNAAMQNRSGTGTGTSTTAPTANATPAASTGNNMADLMGPMAMMSALAQANQSHSQVGDERGREERDAREERERARERNRAAQAANAASGAQAAPPGVAAPTYAGTPPPITTPGAMVDYKFPDGSTVQVSSTIADALQKQQQNTALDAVAAYSGTPGESTPNHPWATVNDVAQLKTGDVVQWEKHSALIINNENGLHILDRGQLIPLDLNSPPLTEKYGNFSGYFHPTGNDVGSDADRGTAAAGPPTVSTPQQAGPPPVAPPEI